MIMMMKTAIFFPKRTTTRTTRTLSQLLTSGRQVANTLNWNHHSANRLLLAICWNGSKDHDQLDLAVTSHPSCNNSSSARTGHGTTISSMTIPLDQGKTYLQDLLNNNTMTTKCHNDDTSTMNIQGLIVGWPRQPDGWLGYQCGKVLHLLDSIETFARPAVCLFDGTTTTTTKEGGGVNGVNNGNHHNGDDVWGRNPIYGRITPLARAKRPHIASQEQYYPITPITTCRAADLADQFCRMHWPEYYQKQEHQHNEQGVDDDDEAAQHQHVSAATTTTDLWAAPRNSTFRGSLLPRSVPMMMMMPPQHSSWMSTSDHQQQHATGMHHHRRSLASA
jgi:hypothetical protein